MKVGTQEATAASRADFRSSEPSRALRLSQRLLDLQEQRSPLEGLGADCQAHAGNRYKPSGGLVPTLPP